MSTRTTRPCHRATSKTSKTKVGLRCPLVPLYPSSETLPPPLPPYRLYLLASLASLASLGSLASPASPASLASLAGRVSVTWESIASVPNSASLVMRLGALADKFGYERKKTEVELTAEAEARINAGPSKRTLPKNPNFKENEPFKPR